MFEAEVFEEIIQAWEDDQNHSNRNREERPPPSPDQIRTLVETSFLASLKAEEGEPVTFSVALVSQEDAEEYQSHPAGRRQIRFSFDSPVSFSAESIRKLSGAFNSQTTVIAAHPTDNDNSGWEMWGALFFGSRSHLFDDIPVGLGDLILFPPDSLIITANSPGSLLIARGNTVLGSFSEARFKRIHPSPLSSVMQSYLTDVIPDISLQRYYRTALRYILTSVSERGAGGTIILLPSNEGNGNFYEPNHASQDTIGLTDIFHRIREAEDLTRAALNQKCREILQFIAQLACVDGALILTNALEVATFGAKLHGHDWIGNGGHVSVPAYGNTVEGGDFDLRSRGTRHRSTFNFVGSCPGSVGFVISEDGPIRGVVRHTEDTLLCWPDCRTSISTDRTIT
jgi:hypothetical protein